MSRHPTLDPSNALATFLNDFSDCFWCEPRGRRFTVLQHPAEQRPPLDVRFRFELLDDLHRLIPNKQDPPLAKLIRFALSDGERIILQISDIDRGDLREPQQTIAHQSNDCRIPQPCEQIRSTRIAGVSNRGETTLFDYADYQVASSLETLSGTVKQSEDAEKAIQTVHQQGKSIRKIARDLGIPWRKANKLLNI